MRKSVYLSLFFFLPVFSAQAELCPSTAINMPATTPTDRFEYQQDSVVVIDKQTGLKWARCQLGYDWDKNNRACVQNDTATFTWTKALIFIKNDPLYLDEKGWRLPNIKELASLVEHKCYNPAINNEVFPGTQAGVFMSNTHVAGNGKVRAVNFSAGEVGVGLREDGYYLRLVKDADVAQ